MPNPCGTYTVTDIPAAKVGEVEAGFKLEGATVASKQQPNGLWTVTATFPPCPDGTNPQNTKAYGS